MFVGEAVEEKRNEELDIVRNAMGNSFAKQVIHPPCAFQHTHTHISTCTGKCRFHNTRLVKNESVPLFRAVDSLSQEGVCVL